MVSKIVVVTPLTPNPSSNPCSLPLESDKGVVTAGSKYNPTCLPFLLSVIPELPNNAYFKSSS